jgi:diaminopimelate epimerase
MTPFLKMHGLGNDFVVFDARNRGLALDARSARILADRRLGVGCDQVIVIERAANGADAFMRVFNADGGEAESCGNAARCVARLLMDETGTKKIHLDTEGGALACIEQGALVRVDMGRPKFGWHEIPLAKEVDTKSFALDVAGFDEPGLKSASAVSVGNPHCVLFVADAERALVETLGPAIERYPLFPERTNVEFVSVLGVDRLRMRVWERGAGITLACGTGACAAIAAAQRRGLCGTNVEIVLDGGSLLLEWAGGDAPIFMTGPSALAWRGEIDLGAL